MFYSIFCCWGRGIIYFNPIINVRYWRIYWRYPWQCSCGYSDARYFVARGVPGRSETTKCMSCSSSSFLFPCVDPPSCFVLWVLFLFIFSITGVQFPISVNIRPPIHKGGCSGLLDVALPRSCTCAWGGRMCACFVTCPRLSLRSGPGGALFVCVQDVGALFALRGHC